MDLFDLRKGTLLKSVSAIRGIVCGKAQFAAAVLKRRDEMLATGADILPTSSIIQTLHVLGLPTLLQRHLRRLVAATIFVRGELHGAGFHVCGNAISPILPVYAVRPSAAAKLSYALRKVGLLAALFVPLQSPSGVRVCLSAGQKNDTVNGLVSAIITAAQAAGLIHETQSRPNLFKYSDEPSIVQEGLEAHQCDRADPKAHQARNGWLRWVSLR